MAHFDADALIGGTGRQDAMTIARAGRIHADDPLHLTGGERGDVSDDLVGDLDRPQRTVAHVTRSTYAPVRVSTRTTSPVLTKKGTFRVRPVSVVAGLPPPAAVSPRNPGAVCVTFRSTVVGSSTPSAWPSYIRTSIDVLSFRYFSVSPSWSSFKGIWS